MENTVVGKRGKKSFPVQESRCQHFDAFLPIFFLKDVFCFYVLVIISHLHFLLRLLLFFFRFSKANVYSFWNAQNTFKKVQRPKDIPVSDKIIGRCWLLLSPLLKHKFQPVQFPASTILPVGQSSPKVSTPIERQINNSNHCHCKVKGFMIQGSRFAENQKPFPNTVLMVM